MTRKIEILRYHKDGSMVRRTPGSSVVQVFLRGRFVSALPTAEMAMDLLDKLQSGADRRCGLAQRSGT